MSKLVQHLPKIRYVVLADLDEIYEIERSLYEHPFSLSELEKLLVSKNCVSLCALKDNKIVGYIIYELYAKKISIVNLSVDIIHQRNGVGTQLIDNIKNKLSLKKRLKIVIDVAERNLNAQLFLKNMGFLYIKTKKKFYEQSNMDAYYFEFNIGEEK